MAEIWDFLGTYWSAILSLVISIGAFGVSLRVWWENRKYKAPAFRITAAPSIGPDAYGFVLTNVGETRASRVRLTFPWDTTGIFSPSGPLEWQLIDAGESVDFLLLPVLPVTSSPSSNWLEGLLSDNPERRQSRIEYLAIDKSRSRQDLLLPSRDEIAIARFQAS
ncbi:MAG: hypothetical protein KKF42_08155 [Actinobacteria bacterium]|nr:hypothetical protein [Actinomycetota bacterium]